MYYNFNFSSLSETVRLLFQQSLVKMFKQCYKYLIFELFTKIIVYLRKVARRILRNGEYSTVKSEFKQFRNTNNVRKHCCSDRPRAGLLSKLATVATLKYYAFGPSLIRLIIILHRIQLDNLSKTVTCFLSDSLMHENR